VPDPAAIPPPPDPAAWSAAWSVVGYLGALGAAVGGAARAWAPAVRLARHLLGVDDLQRRVDGQDAAIAAIHADIRELANHDPTPALVALDRTVADALSELRQARTHDGDGHDGARPRRR
jgi:hypothetical protein